MIAVLALSALIGVTLGLLGGGGSILTVPILVYVAQLPARDAIATSLFVVGITSAVALLTHVRARRVVWRVGVPFGLASMVGAFFGGRVAHYVPSSWLLGGFTLMMVVTALAMMRPRSENSVGEASSVRALVVGVGIGLLTGVVGAGGGFVIVPALVLLSGLSTRQAVATSLLVISMNSLAGFAGAVAHATVPWRLAGVVTVAAVLGSVLGAAFANRLRPDSLRKGFAWFVLVMAGFMVVKQVHASSPSASSDRVR